MNPMLLQLLLAQQQGGGIAQMPQQGGNGIGYGAGPQPAMGGPQIPMQQRQQANAGGAVPMTPPQGPQAPPQQPGLIGQMAGNGTGTGGGGMSPLQALMAMRAAQNTPTSAAQLNQNVGPSMLPNSIDDPGAQAYGQQNFMPNASQLQNQSWLQRMMAGNSGGQGYGGNVGQGWFGNMWNGGGSSGQ